MSRLWLLPGEKNAIVVSDSLYLIYPNLRPGDQLTIKLLDQHKETWTVVGVFPFLSMFGDPMAYANMILSPRRTARKTRRPCTALSPSSTTRFPTWN